jgi:hypothetical protein
MHGAATEQRGVAAQRMGARIIGNGIGAARSTGAGDPKSELTSGCCQGAGGCARSKLTEVQEDCPTLLAAATITLMALERKRPGIRIPISSSESSYLCNSSKGTYLPSSWL